MIYKREHERKMEEGKDQENFLRTIQINAYLMNWIKVMVDISETKITWKEIGNWWLDYVERIYNLERYFYL